jgi:hypothetical protein
MVRDAALARFGLDAEALAGLLHASDANAAASCTRVVVVECNAHQAEDIAAQLEERWPLEAVPRSLDLGGPLPRLPIVGTRFHHAEMRRRWPSRVRDMHFVSLALDATVVQKIRTRAKQLRTRSLVLCELDQATGRAMAADLRSLLPRSFAVGVSRRSPADLLAGPKLDSLLVVAPRVWAGLSAEQRLHPRLIEQRYLIERTDLETLGLDLGVREALPRPRRGGRKKTGLGAERSLSDA